MFRFKCIVFVYLPFPRTLKVSPGEAHWQHSRINFTVASPTTVTLLEKDVDCSRNSVFESLFCFCFLLQIDIIEDWPHMTSSST